MSSDPSNQVLNAAEIFSEEKTLIECRRAAAGYPVTDTDTLADLVGLALSGGGIRSATFSLGVLQVLERHRVMRHVDYLSTVSGGGYAGCAYSAYKTRESLRREPRRDNNCPEIKCVHRDSLNGAFLTHLRKFSNYLSPRLGLGTSEFWRIVGTTVRNVSLHWVVLLSAVVSIFALILLLLRLPLLLTTDLGPSLVMAGAIALLLGSASSVIYLGVRQEWRVKKALHAGAAIGTEKELLEATRSPVFVGLALWGLGASLGFVYSTYVAHGSWITIALLLLGVFIIAVAGFASEWRWSPRRDFRPRWAWFGFLFVIALPAVTWFALHAANDPSARRSATEFLQIAWLWVWQTGVVLLVLGLMIGIVIAAFSDEMSREEREWATLLASSTLATAVAWMGLTGLALLSVWSATEASMAWPSVISAIGATSLWVGISALAAYLGKTETIQTVLRAHWKRIVVAIGPALFLVGLVVLTGFIAALLLVGDGKPLELWQGARVFYLLLGALLLFIAAGFALDGNEFSPHGFYRDRLVRCYLGASNADTVAPDSVWNIRSDDLPLHCVRRAIEQFGAPLHIINTAVNLFGSRDLHVRQRGCDSFVLTPLHCGSTVTRYTKIPDGLYLGTAMAISGAAFNSAMGLATRGAGLAAVLTFFNLRLGYWFGNPRREVREDTKRPLFSPKYLFLEALSLTNENRHFVNLSDGGHFDNLGIYELVRRRCRLIIVVDAERDERYTFSSLAQVIRLVRIDFNVEIALNFKIIAPAAEGGRYAQGHWALGRIDYTKANEKVSAAVDNPSGEILYIKSSLLCDDDKLPGDILGYAQGSRTFPHETTADQFFSEAQFESYRRLGEHTGNKLVDVQLEIDGKRAVLEDYLKDLRA